MELLLLGLSLGKRSCNLKFRAFYGPGGFILLSAPSVKSDVKVLFLTKQL
jgi:hypothetical protein